MRPHKRGDRDPNMLPLYIYVIEWETFSQDMGGQWFYDEASAIRHASNWGAEHLRGIRKYRIDERKTVADKVE